ncbi:NlpC/P60 family protein [Brochothrix thermosphacta]|uniref:NlpC/P60 family protein n=1 Tax=Brochothrix thermosphacta TaxID=2756 RepID=UPI00271393DB|nr:NlpC/P60 family protein [Brochothrix thermosphacta]MDO7864704.1 NlpC/P60 family protein [Brochothrix thermosphacta]
MKSSKIIAIALAAAITVSPFAGIASTSVSASESSATIASKKADMKSQLADIVQQESEVSAKVAANQKEFTQLKKDQVKLEKSIEETKAAIDKRKGKLEERARAMQTSSATTSIVDSVLEADSITDAAAAVIAYSKFQSADVSIVEAQQKDENKLAADNKSLSAKIDNQRSVIASSEVAAGKLAAQKAEKEVLVAKLANDEKRAQKAEKVAAELAAAAAVQPIKTDVKEVAKADEKTETSTVAKAETKTGNVVSVVNTSTNKTDDTKKAENKPAKETTDNNAGSVVSGVSGAIQEAYKYAGQAYGGGAVPGNFDCSGLVMYSYAKAGISLPRTAAAQYGATTRISESQAQAGDLVFFSDGGISHVGIYLGGGQMFNSQNNGIQTDNIHGAYWGEHLAGFGRIN